MLCSLHKSRSYLYTIATAAEGKGKCSHGPAVSGTAIQERLPWGSVGELQHAEYAGPGNLASNEATHRYAGSVRLGCRRARHSAHCRERMLELREDTPLHSDRVGITAR